MAEHNFPSNSKSAAPKPKGDPEKKDLKSVVTGEVVQRKKPLGKRIAETFTGEDAHSVGNHILMDVLIPAAKNAISDAVTQGIERMLFGEVRRGRSTVSRPQAYTSYSRVSSPGRAFQADEATRSVSRRARMNHDFKEIIIADRGEAEMVLDSLGNVLDAYDVVTVNDLYSLVGITGSYTDEKYGWNDLRGARVERIRDGYILNLPPTIPLD